MSGLFVDPVGGIAGDMLLAALIDAGAPEEAIRSQLATLRLEGWELTVVEEVRRGFRGRRVDVTIGESHAHRGLEDVLAILRRGSLAPGALERAEHVFRRLAEAEAFVHGIALERVHFHEVGAVDSIVDVAGVSIALELLGAHDLFAGPLPLGTGNTTGAHGVFPLPSPATAHLLDGRAVHFTGRPGEHTTPTGAAIVSALAREDTWPGRVTLGPIGVGFGARQDEVGPPNMVRVMRLDAAAPRGAVDVIEANLDDMTPEWLSDVTERLIDDGALDVFVTPVQMKKGRSGHLLTVLAPVGRADALASLVLAHSTTIGLRVRREARHELDRRIETVETDYGTIRVKVVVRPGGRETAAPEYDDCRRAARSSNVPVREVYREAEAAWWARAANR